MKPPHFFVGHRNKISSDRGTKQKPVGEISEVRCFEKQKLHEFPYRSSRCPNNVTK